MKMIRKFGLLSLLLIATLAVHNASATISELIYLPDSSYAEAQDAWQGFSIYDELGFYVRIDFAVYDTDNLQNQDEIALAEALDMEGRYIYAYQIFQNYGEGYEDVACFGLLDIDKNPINAPLMDVNSLDDNNGHSGMEPATVANTPIAWKWQEFAGGLLTTGQHSWFLVFSCDYAPVAGDYEIKSPEPEQETDFPVVPEPGTLILLGLGSTAAFVRPRKSV